MKILKHILMAVICLTSSYSIAQRPGGQRPSGSMPEGNVLLGKIVDKQTQHAIEYANIAIYSTNDSKLVTGGITDSEGRFMIDNLKPGNYYATFMFIGYETSTKKDIIISADNKMTKIGVVALQVNAHNLNELDVVADKQQVVYKIDKKVINPSQFMAAQGGSAVDILSNTPSVSVDIEGNVSMRGSSNFLVLINGKPTPFDASDALAQIPATSIDNIEIITNPSAKYDPDGAAGIINIITKQDAQKGWNGMINASASTLGSYSGDALFNFTGNKTRWYVGLNRTDRLRKADYTSGSGTIDTDSGDTTHIFNNGSRNMNFYSNSIKTGVDYDINKNNTVGIELKAGNKGRIFDNDLATDEWSTGEDIVSSLSNTATDALGEFYTINLNQSTNFNGDKNHTLKSSFLYQRENSDDDSYTLQTLTDGTPTYEQSTWEQSEESKLQFNTDYSRPWAQGKIEAGYQFKLNEEWSEYNAEFDDVEDNSIFYNQSDFYRMINSVYSTFSGEQGQFGYQLGLRAEHTLRTIEQENSTETSEIKRLDWYPTVHLSYNMKADQSIMSSYSRRIDRPRSHWLDPYVAWQDPNSVRQGNPDLAPQYINSYEVSYQKKFGNNFISAELFHRNVTDKIERVQGKYDDGVILSSFENIGKDYSTGLELMLNYNIAKWWSINLSGSVYDYRLEVNSEFEESVTETQSNNWRSRFSNTFKPTSNLRIQFDAMYNSPTITATGTRDGMAFTSLAVKHSFFKNKLDVGVSVMDLFDTAKMEVHSSNSTFYSDYSYDMVSPNFQFSISYMFNNYKPERKRGSGASVDMEY